MNNPDKQKPRVIKREDHERERELPQDVRERLIQIKRSARALCVEIDKLCGKRIA